MTCRERQRQRQEQRAEKITEDILSGKSVYAVYKDRSRKKAQPNRKCSEQTSAEEVANREAIMENAARLPYWFYSAFRSGGGVRGGTPRCTLNLY